MPPPARCCEYPDSGCRGPQDRNATASLAATPEPTAPVIVFPRSPVAELLASRRASPARAFLFFIPSLLPRFLFPASDYLWSRSARSSRFSCPPPPRARDTLAAWNNNFSAACTSRSSSASSSRARLTPARLLRGPSVSPWRGTRTRKKKQHTAARRISFRGLVPGRSPRQSSGRNRASLFIYRFPRAYVTASATALAPSRGPTVGAPSRRERESRLRRGGSERFRPRRICPVCR